MTNREKALVTVLPAILIVGTYGYFVLIPKWKVLRDTQARASEQTRRPPAAGGGVGAELAKLAAVRKELADDAKATEDLKKRWEAALGASGPPLCRPERIERLNQLIDRAGLRVVEGGDLDSGASSGTAHPLDALAAELGDRCGHPPPRVRVVKLHGRYSEMTAALTAIARSGVLAVPVALTMKSLADDTERQEWTLHVWI